MTQRESMGEKSWVWVAATGVVLTVAMLSVLHGEPAEDAEPEPADVDDGAG